MWSCKDPLPWKIMSTVKMLLDSQWLRLSLRNAKFSSCYVCMHYFAHISVNHLFAPSVWKLYLIPSEFKRLWIKHFIILWEICMWDICLFFYIKKICFNYPDWARLFKTSSDGGYVCVTKTIAGCFPSQLSLEISFLINVSSMCILDFIHIVSLLAEM